MPEAPEPEDRGFASDTYGELVRKARDLQQRLIGTNVAPHVLASVRRLLGALGARFDDIRPALLLSHERSIGAVRSAFSDELPADVIAMMDDTRQTLLDLLAAFPKIRPIEAGRAALDLDRNPDAIPAVRHHMMAIKAAAEQSGVVTKAAISALGYNDAAIEDATDPVEQTSLIGYSLLVCRNFVGVVIGAITSPARTALGKAGTELGELAGKSWQAIKDELPKGMGATARILPLVALITLAGLIAGPAASMASLVPAFKPISEALKNAIKDGLKDTPTSKEKQKPNGQSGQKKP